MKKTVLVILAALLVLLICASATAETVYVTISTGEGTLAIANEAVETSDLDGDGAVSIDEALACAHEAFYEGGAAAGYLSENTDYGRSMLRLWGEENGGSYGYYLNNASPMSLLDAVADGDSIHAYAYQDLAGWSDTYCYFQASSAEMAAGDSVNLTLTALVYDADWNLNAVPVENAELIINAEACGIKTDAEGCAAVTLSEPGEYVISARCEGMTLVPPVCIITVA